VAFSFPVVWHVGFYNALVCGSTTIAPVLIVGHSVRRDLFFVGVENPNMGSPHNRQHRRGLP